MVAVEVIHVSYQMKNLIISEVMVAVEIIHVSYQMKN
jgi:hypothetical protein